MSTHALASLTATYTDSEPEEEDEEEEQQQQQQQQQQFQLQQQQPQQQQEQQQEQKQPSPPAPQEVEKEIEKEPEKKTPPEIELEKDTDSLPASVAVPQQEISSKITKLVSYHDDNIISDEEGDYYYPRTDIEIEDFANHSDISENVELPPEPSGRCSPRLIEKVMKLHEKIESGLDMNNMIQSRKDFRNPSIYEKLIQFCGLNELGTNYPATVYDPLKWGKESFYEELAKVQKVEMEKREKERKDKTKVEFVSGTKKANSLTSEEEMKKRKSKWDQRGAAASCGITLGMIRPAGLLQPSLTTSVTGTKGTVISAFGSLPKKPRI